MASEINYKEFKSTESTLAMAIHTMDIYLTSEISRFNGELTEEFLNDLEYSALDRAQAVIYFQAM